MAERKVRIPMQDGNIVDAYEVPIASSTDRWSDINLEDGSVIRVKMSAGAVFRLADQYDPEGAPVYVVKGSSTLLTVSVPESLRKKD